MAKINISSTQLQRYELIKKTLNREITNGEAALLLHISKRNLIRLKNKVKQLGIKGLEHGNIGKPGHNRIKEEEKELIISLVKEKYLDFTPTLATEKLTENHNIKHDPKTIARVLLDAGVWQKNRILKSKKKEVHRTWRLRRFHYGELIQFDGSYEYWLENRNNTGRLCLLAGIDDATKEKIFPPYFPDRPTVKYKMILPSLLTINTIN